SAIPAAPHARGAGSPAALRRSPMGPFVVIVIFAGIATALVLISLAKRRVVEAAWSEAAQELKLEFIPGGLLGRGKISGELLGFPVRAEIFTRGHGEDSAKYTRVVVD